MASTKNHNAHILIPVNLWTRAKRVAEERGVTMTRFICEALEAKLDKRSSERKHKR